VTGTLPPFAQPGTRIDATAAGIGDASNLQGGLLLLTSLMGPDGQTYAWSRPGGYGRLRGGARRKQQTLNHPTVGRVPSGAIVERTAAFGPPGSQLRLQLRRADFSTASRIAESVNRKFASAGKPLARARTRRW